MDPEFVLYSDFNCPFCYAFGERVIQLQAADRIAWRGVQHAPHLAVPMASAGPTFRRELEREVQSIQRLAPDVPISLPRGKPNTGPAIQAVASALRIDGEKAHALATSFYRALWQHRRDISDSATIHTLMAEAGLHDAIDAAAADSITRSWHNAWLERGVGSVPELVRRDGEALIGLVDRDILHSFLAFR